MTMPNISLGMIRRAWARDLMFTHILTPQIPNFNPIENFCDVLDFRLRPALFSRVVEWEFGLKTIKLNKNDPAPIINTRSLFMCSLWCYLSGKQNQKARRWDKWSPSGNLEHQSEQTRSSLLPRCRVNSQNTNSSKSHLFPPILCLIVPKPLSLSHEQPGLASIFFNNSHIFKTTNGRVKYCYYISRSSKDLGFLVK